METFVALLTMRLLDIKFKAEKEFNPDVIFFVNDKGNSIYLILAGTELTINVFKQKCSCFNRKMYMSDICRTGTDGTLFTPPSEKLMRAYCDDIIHTIKTKLKLKQDLHESSDK